MVGFRQLSLQPKLFCNKEPWLVFTYKIYANNISNITYKQRLEKFDALIELLRKVYKHPEKIFVIESVEEIENILNNLLEQKSNLKLIL